MRILERTGRTVSVTGIDNHELPGLDIVTCAALLNTNHGKVVLIMHEYAYYGRGNTIHSPGQIEWFQNCRILGLPPLIPLLQCVNRFGFEICSVNNCQTE